VREGFERVIRARLADARFFLEQDQKQPLDACIPFLDGIVFQNKIGSVGDKSRRIASISKSIATKLDLDASLCERAAHLAKCDLLTQMVGEFPELQGTMGRHYALHSGEPQAVADAIEQHYLPRFAGDDIPPGTIGQVVGLADRMDTLVAIFAAGLGLPAKTRSPCGARPWLVRILVAAPGYLRAVHAAANSARGQALSPPCSVKEFINERQDLFPDACHGAELISAAMASDWSTLPDLQARLEALSSFLGQPSGLSLAAANKRIGNILRKAESEVSNTIDEDRLSLPEERELYQQIQMAGESLHTQLQHADYAATLQHLSTLRPAVDRFFDAVMVMDEDLALRNNRLALLSRLKALFDRVADLSVLG
jgi:glycyl-tRNA synthetase beta chain